MRRAEPLRKRATSPGAITGTEAEFRAHVPD